MENLSFQRLHRDVIEHDAIYSELLIRTQKHADSLPAGKDKEKITRRLKEITDRWVKVNRTTKERHEKLSNLYPAVVDYDSSISVVEKVIKVGEDFLKTFAPAAVDVEEASKLLSDVRVGLLYFT